MYVCEESLKEFGKERGETWMRIKRENRKGENEMGTSGGNKGISINWC